MSEEDPRKEALARFLSDRTGSAVSVRRIDRITVGNSRAMLKVETSAGRFVVRLEQGGMFGTSGAEEFRIMQALSRAGYPVAPVRWSETSGAVLGKPFFVMDFLDTPPPEGGDERAMDRRTAESFVRAMAGLHALDVSQLASAFDISPPEPSSATHLQIDRWASLYRASTGCSPLLEEAAAWLHFYAPPLERLSIVHGDAGPGNVLVRDGVIVAVTDWEFSHLGDPAEDWSYCVAMRGSRTMSRSDWLALFVDGADISYPDTTWRYWEAFNLFKGACANTTGMALFESGTSRAPNIGIIGAHLQKVFLRRLVDITGTPL